MNKDHSTEVKGLDKRKITFYSLLVSILLVIIKVGVAYYTNSISVFSEALNNGLDLVTVLIAFLSVRIAARPPDRDHTYGHGKYENLSAFIEVIIISLLCIYIIYVSVRRIIYKDFILNLNIYVFLILIFSIIVNIIRVYYIGRAAKKYDSYALKAEFLNYSADIFGSAVVIAGLFLAGAGFMIADPIASILISLIVLTFSLKLLFRVVRNLLDYIPEEVTEKVNGILNNIPEIKSVDKLKIHEVGNIRFINIKICLEDILYLSCVEEIKDKIKKGISEIMPDSEIILETKYLPSRSSTEIYIKEIVMSLPYVKDTHDVFIYNIDSRIDISINVEMEKNIKLNEAEKMTKIIEEKIKEKVKNIRSVYIHIEDFRDGEDWNDITRDSYNLISDIRKEVSLYTDPETCHNFTILEKGGLRNIAFHCRLQQNIDIKKAHAIVTRLENEIKRKFKNVNEVLIHVEPG
jgi:cation diffusion facilitator family transporter